MAGRMTLIAAAALAWAWLTVAADPARADSHAFDELAAELLDLLKRHDPPGVMQMVAAKRRIALWPFRDDELPVSREAAQGFNDALLAALMRQAQGRYAFIGRRELVGVIAELEQTGQGLDDPVAAMAKHARTDVLIQGSMLPAGIRLSLSYKAIGVVKDLRGQVLAQTRARDVAMPEASPSLQVDAAMRRLARALSDGAPGALEIRLAGIRYQRSGIETPLARYLEERLVGALTAAYGNAITGRQLAVTRAALTTEQVARMRGIDTPPRELKDAMGDKRPGVYKLGGSYWSFSDGVQLSVTLSDAGNQTVAGEQRIAAASLPLGLAVRPPGDFQSLRENDHLGPIQLTLSSDRGRRPAYRIGETAQLLIRLDRQAFLYCFYLQADGQMVRVFPNAHHRHARLDGGRVHTIPGDIFPFDLKITEPPGAELLKCFATNRDAMAELPAELRAVEQKIVAPALAQRLPLLFQGLRGAETSEASLVMTVTR
ncbi:MAG: DUF4384 domain-containing protein [Alphaproteobacteria bacterium]|nr:DUF4384 domain-containing protein [Alphaproteobacteria bacterium]